MSKRALSALFALALAFTAGSVQAQDPEAGEVSVSSSRSSSARSSSTGSRGPTRVYGGIHLGGGGNLKVMPEDFDSDKVDMKFLVGFQGGLDHVIHQYVALGGEFRFTSTDIKYADERPILVDFTFKPRGRYEFSNIPLEVYGTLPLGFSVVAPRNDGDTKFNMNFGIGAGAMYFFTEKLGINAELTGIFHWFRQTYDGPLNTDFTVRNRMGQFYWFTNVVYVL